jgi:hypothetical protein
LPAKKALGNKCHQSSITKITELMPVDPKVSNMEIVLLSARDLEGPNAAKVQKAIDSKHSDVCVIYFYASDKERALLHCPYMRECKKVRDSDISDSITQFYGDHAINTSSAELHSIYDNAGEIDRIENFAVGQTAPEPEPEPDPSPIPEPVAEEPEPAQLDLPPATEEPSEEQPVPLVKNSDLEEKLESIRDFHDWDFFKKALAQESITRHLIEENTEYQGILNMLKVYDLKIREVFNNTMLSAEEKFEQIREFGNKRSVLKEAENRIACQKLVSLIEIIVRTAGRTVDEKVSGVQEAITKLSVDKKAVIEGVELQPLMEKKLHIQLELMNMLKELIEVYKAMDVSVADRIGSMDKGLPSDNEFISEMVNPVKNLFLPKNSPGLTTLIMESLQQGRITLSALENKINGIMNLVFELGSIDQEIIDYHQKVISMLKAHRCEDIVIRDSLIKDVLRIYIGGEDSGKTATALAWAGMMSRRHNVLVVDLSTNSKLGDYGITPVSLDEFYTDRKHEQLLVVAGQVGDDPEQIFVLNKELRERVSYYPCIVVLLDSAQGHILDQLSDDALVANYVTNCTTRSLAETKKVMSEHKASNIARRLIVIDPPCDIMDITRELGVDITLVNVVPIPYLREMKTCTFKRMLPHTDSTVLAVFEEAFH